MSTKKYIYNALLCNRAIDVCVEDGIILSVEANKGVPPAGEYIDATGKKIFPSFLDVHTHTREPGYVHKESIATALKAGLYGGFSGIFCMANTKPVNDTALVTQYMLAKAKEAFPNGPYLYPIGASTLGLQGEEIAPMKSLADAGCVAFSNDGAPVCSSAMLRNCMEYASGVGKIVIEHCEDTSFGGARAMNEGSTSSMLGIQGDPDISEAIHVARAVLLSEYLQIPIHIAHVSSHRSVEVLAQAKAKKGCLVTAETCPHYLLLEDTELEGYNSLAKVNPPLRTRKDIEALRSAVKSGVIDMLATDHAPHTLYEKNQPLALAPFGLSGLDIALPLTWKLVCEGVLTEEDLIRLWCVAPHERFSLPYTTFTKGSVANFFLFDPSVEWVLTPEEMHSKGKNTPFMGTLLHGRVTDHWIAGRKIL